MEPSSLGINVSEKPGRSRGPGEAHRQQDAADRFGQDISRLLRLAADSDRVYYARCKRALIVRDWIEGATTVEIEDRYSSNAFSRIAYGDVIGYADGVRFILESVLRIAAIIHEVAYDPAEAALIFKRLELGLPAAMLALVHRHASLSRGAILQLWRARVTTFAQLAAMPLEECQQIVGARARELQTSAARIAALMGQ